MNMAQKPMVATPAAKSINETPLGIFLVVTSEELGIRLISHFAPEISGDDRQMMAEELHGLAEGLADLVPPDATDGKPDSEYVLVPHKSAEIARLAMMILGNRLAPRSKDILDRHNAILKQAMGGTDIDATLAQSLERLREEHAESV